LPASNGGVRCFKFRDPDRHPLELLWLPPGEGRAVWHALSTAPRGERSPFAGIDHSAISVASAERSLDFYHALGMTTANRSLNAGPAQAHLDGLEGAHVRVTSLRPASPSGPGLELLAYQPPGRASASSVIDVSTDWVTIQATAAAATPPCALRDPDGHRLLLVPQ
jgi:catechol 2,3-dioxygenase-like lactoylglutathione lyase family enzyme